MALKSLKFKILYGSVARRVLLRSFMVVSALSIASLLPVLFGSNPVIFNAVYSTDCTVTWGYWNLYNFLDRFMTPTMSSIELKQCKENVNMTANVVEELMGLRMLSNDAKALVVSQGSASSVCALRELGFTKACGVYRHPFFSLMHKSLVFELDYEDESFDFVFSTDLDKVSVPALLVLEIERVLRHGGIGAMLVGISSASPNSLLRSATSVSSILKSSIIVHVGHVNGLTLVAFKKKIETVSYFERFELPGDCQSHNNNEPFMQFLEPLVQEKPVGSNKNVTYLPKFFNAASKKRLLYIIIGAGENLNSNVHSWFLPSYPVDHQAFNVYFVDHNTSVMLSYVKRPGITFVYHPDLAGSKAQANPDAFQDPNPYGDEDDFDFLLWFKETVHYADFVVLKMNAGEVERKFISELFKSGTICSVDELFLRCSDYDTAKDAVGGSCMDLFHSLRRSGVFVHQWWDD